MTLNKFSKWASQKKIEIKRFKKYVSGGLRNSTVHSELALHEVHPGSIPGTRQFLSNTKSGPKTKQNKQTNKKKIL